MKPPTMYQYLKAPNDRWGEPRRLWLLLNEDGELIVSVVGGLTNERPPMCYGLIELPEMIVTPKTYQTYAKFREDRKEMASRRFYTQAQWKRNTGPGST